MQAEGLDRREDRDLIAADVETASGDRVGDVAGRHGAVKLTGLAGLTQSDEALAVELVGDGLRFVLQLEVAGLKLHALRLEALLVAFVGAQGLALGQKEVAAVTVLDADDIAHLTQLGDALEQNDLHDILLKGWWMWVWEGTAAAA